MLTGSPPVSPRTSVGYGAAHGSRGLQRAPRGRRRAARPSPGSRRLPAGPPAATRRRGPPARASRSARARPRRRRAPPRPVVGHPQTSSSSSSGSSPRRWPRARVLARIGQRLLHDPVGGQRRTVRQRRGTPSTVKHDRQARRPHLFDQVLEWSSPAAGRARARSRPRGAGRRAAGACRSAPCGRSRRSRRAPAGPGGIGASAYGAPSACTTMTQTLWAITSCSSRAILARSAAAAIWAWASRSVSSRAARSSRLA